LKSALSDLVGVQEGWLTPFLQGGRSEGVADDVRGQVLGEARPDGDLVEQELGAARPVRERLVEGEVVLESCRRTAGHGHDTDLGFLAVRTALAPDAELLPQSADRNRC